MRFVELLCPERRRRPLGPARQPARRATQNNARAVDQPIAGLLTDLKARGLLDATLVVWGGEFGRTPMAQGTDGRDHNPYGFTIWLAGGGVKGGTIHGATDDYGYHAVENKVEIHDLHATMLHLLGIDHKRLTYRFGGRDMRLTDVHGEVITGDPGLRSRRALTPLKARWWLRPSLLESSINHANVLNVMLVEPAQQRLLFLAQVDIRDIPGVEW